MYTLKLIPVPNFRSLGWFWFLSTVISCWQLLTADDSWYDKNLTGIFIYTLKFILVPNFSSLGWFSFSSVVNSCYQLLTADDSCHEKKLNGIFIYSLKLIPVPNFSSPGCLGARLESVTPHRQTDARTYARTDRGQVKLVLTPALLGWCQGPSRAKRKFYCST